MSVLGYARAREIAVVRITRLRRPGILAVNNSGLAFAERELDAGAVRGSNILEVGSFDTTGSVRPHAETLTPASYLGVDIVPGPRVDQICDVRHLVATFGAQAFDVVIATELVEHVRDWRSAFFNLTGVLRVGGTLLITTRSLGFPYHFGPEDWWRYEPDDMFAILGDFDQCVIERDPEAPGVFFSGVKSDRPPAVLDRIALYSMIVGRRALDVSDQQVRRAMWTNWRMLARRLPRPIRKLGKRTYELVLRREL